jgi:hypothetical protein
VALATCMKETQCFDMYSAALIVLGISEELKPHKFFKNLGFSSPLPDVINSWQQQGCKMAAIDLMLTDIIIGERGEAIIREANLISQKVVAKMDKKKKHNVKASSKNKVIDAGSNVDHLEEEKGDY